MTTLFNNTAVFYDRGLEYPVVVSKDDSGGDNFHVPYFSKTNYDSISRVIFSGPDGNRRARSNAMFINSSQHNVLCSQALNHFSGKVVLVGVWEGDTLTSILGNPSVEEVYIVEIVPTLVNSYADGLSSNPNKKKVKRVLTGDVYTHLSETLSGIEADCLHLDVVRPVPSLSSWISLYMLGNLAKKHKVLRDKGKVSFYGMSRFKEELTVNVASSNTRTNLEYSSFPLFLSHCLSDVIRRLKVHFTGDLRSSIDEKCGAIQGKLGDHLYESIIRGELWGNMAIMEPIISQFMRVFENTHILKEDSAYICSINHKGQMHTAHVLFYCVNLFLRAMGLPEITEVNINGLTQMEEGVYKDLCEEVKKYAKDRYNIYSILSNLSGIVYTAADLPANLKLTTCPTLHTEFACPYGKRSNEEIVRENRAMLSELQGFTADARVVYEEELDPDETDPEDGDSIDKVMLDTLRYPSTFFNTDERDIRSDGAFTRYGITPLTL